MLKDVLVVCSVTAVAHLSCAQVSQTQAHVTKTPECFVTSAPAIFIKRPGCALGILGVSFSLFHSLFIGEVELRDELFFWSRY